MCEYDDWDEQMEYDEMISRKEWERKQRIKEEEDKWQ